MFAKLPNVIDTSKWEDGYYGKGTSTKIINATPFRTRETCLINDVISKNRWDEGYVQPYNIIGETNLTIVDDHLIISEKSMFRTNAKVEYIDNDNFLRFDLYHELNRFLFGYVKYGPGLYLRPIFQTKKDRITSARDIEKFIGFQLLSRDNEVHNKTTPIFVRGVKYAKKKKS